MECLFSVIVIKNKKKLPSERCAVSGDVCMHAQGFRV